LILEKYIVGPLGTNCYIFGSQETREVVIIDPGAEPNVIIRAIEEKSAKPIAVMLTHGHFDHALKSGKILRTFKIPLMYNKKDFDYKIYTRKRADKWLKDGDCLHIGEISLYILETPGHSPGSLSFYSKGLIIYNKKKFDGVIFTGDLLFRRSVGRSDILGGNENQLFHSIKYKIINNPEITDNFLVCPGHMGMTTIQEEKKLNFFKNYFL